MLFSSESTSLVSQSKSRTTSQKNHWWLPTTTTADSFHCNLYACARLELYDLSPRQISALIFKVSIEKRFSLFRTRNGDLFPMLIIFTELYSHITIKLVCSILLMEFKVLCKDHLITEISFSLLLYKTTETQVNYVQMLPEYNSNRKHFCAVLSMVIYTCTSVVVIVVPWLEYHTHSTHSE